MIEIIDIVLPVFALAGLGYLTARTGYLSQSVGDGLAKFVFNLAIPLLLFRSLATAEYADANPWWFWLSYFSAVFVAWFLAWIIVAKIARRGARASVIAGVAAGFSNLVLVGIPLIDQAYGTAGLNIHLLLVAVHLPVMMATSSFLMEFAAKSDGATKNKLSLSGFAINMGRSFLENPIMWGIVLGSLWRFTDMGINMRVDGLIDLIARTAVPLALFSLGMSFVKYGIRGNWQPAIGLALVSVLVMPSVVLFAGTMIFALPALWLKVAVVAAACPTGVNAYLFATYFRTAEGLASPSIVIAALMSIITLPFWLAVMQTY